MENIEYVEKKLFSEKSASEKMNIAIKEALSNIRNRENLTIGKEELNKIIELAGFISRYINEVGKEQAIVDFQTGLNLLNNYRKDSIVEEKAKLEEDGDFGEKTYAALLKAMDNYSLSVISDYIKQGAVNNMIWNTKNSTSVDTDKKVSELVERLEV